MEKIILSTAPELEANLKAIEDFPRLAQDQVNDLIKLENETSLGLLKKDCNCATLLKSLEVVTNSDRLRQLGLSDPNEDSEIFSEWIRLQLYKKQFRSIETPITGSPKLDQFDPVLPDLIIKKLVVNQKLIDTYLYQLPSNQNWREYVSLKGGRITIKKNAPEEIKERLTMYATPIQTKAYNSLKSLILEIERIEKEQKLPNGFVLETIQHDSTYHIYNQKIQQL